jgi:L-threonylcarbamoyladenylate synthase
VQSRRALSILVGDLFPSSLFFTHVVAPMTCSIGTDVQHAAAILRDGGLVAFATETVYGLGADALNPQSVARVFEAKQRPKFDPLIVHVAELAQLDSLVKQVPPMAEQLAAAFWPGPLTMVLEKESIVPDLVTAGLTTVAVRIPAHPLALDLLRKANIPVAAPSANPFGRISPTTAAHVAEQLGDEIDYILDGGPSQVGVESTVLQLTADAPLLLRPGGLALEDIEAVIGPVSIPNPDARPELTAQHSPGRLPKHYAPRTPLVIQNIDSMDVKAGTRIGLLAFSTPSDVSDFTAVEVLSADGNLNEAATHFFAALRRLDAAGVDQIIAEPFPDEGLGRALNDRLKRAAQK